MTTQLSDLFTLSGETFDVLRGSVELFHPREIGVEKPAGRSSALWRGYLCEYEVVGEHVLLERLLLHVDVVAAPRVVALSEQLLGRRPRVEGDGELRYEGLGRAVHVSGELLLGSGFTNGPQEQGGHHPARDYERVLAVELQGGKVITARDSSATYAEQRASLPPDAGSAP